MNSFWTVEDTLKLDIPEGNLLEFGLYHGDTMERLVKGFPSKFKEVYGFDSFEGLPANNEGNDDWPKGAFNVCKDDGFASIQEAKDFIRKRVGREDINLVEGWFKDTLTERLANKLRNTASYIHLDCDLFVSTRTCLEWLLEYNIPKIGCLFRYDDWYSVSSAGGQRAAHFVTSYKHRSAFNQIADNVYIYEGKL